MKTIKDFYAVYPDGWPNMFADRCVVCNGQFIFRSSSKPNDYPIVCTREEYEQYKAEQESKNMKSDWYDYDEQEWNGKNRPDKGSLVLLNDVTVSVVLHDNKSLDQVCVRHQNGALSITKVHYLTPLDHDKHTVKTAPLEWMIECGLDVEFSSDRDSRWFISNLHVLNERGEFVDDDKDRWRNCRPRMNHKHVLTQEQFDLIPTDVFDIDYRVTFDSEYIVEFKGLKDGYKYECDK